MPVRLCCFLLIFALWLWSGSIFAPWALSPNPRLWLYDLLFYTRFVLLFWGVIELLLACRQLRDGPGLPKPAFVTISVVGFAAFCMSAYAFLMSTGDGYRLRVQMSSGDLALLKHPAYLDQRQRAGWFLIDNLRQPCIEQAWLWLGEVYGGGSGNNLALVYHQGKAPKTPSLEGFRFWPVSDHWWLAYQNPEKYQLQNDADAGCVEGLYVNSHREGMMFVKTGGKDR